MAVYKLMTMKKYLLLLPAALLVFSCKKNSTATVDSITIDARIVYTGDFAADGCGYTLELNPETHELWPIENLDAAYAVNDLKVHVSYHKIVSRGCRQVPPDPKTPNTVYIDAISRR